MFETERKKKKKQTEGKKESLRQRILGKKLMKGAMKIEMVRKRD